MHITIADVPPSVIAWVHAYSAKNYWKVAGLADYDDLIAEGYLAISYCLNRYGTKLDPPHLMRLVQLTFSCAIVDIAKKRTRLAESHASDLVGEGKEDYFWDRISGKDNQAELSRLISEAPDLVKKALIFLMNEKKGEMRECYPQSILGERQTTSNRLCGLLHISLDIDIMGLIRNYLRGE